MLEIIKKYFTVFNLTSSLIGVYLAVKHPYHLLILLIGGISFIMYYPLDNPVYSHTLSLSNDNDNDGKSINLVTSYSNKSIDKEDLVTLTTNPYFIEWFKRFSNNILVDKRISYDEIQVDSINMIDNQIRYSKFTVNPSSNNPIVVFHKPPNACLLFIIKCENTYYALLTLKLNIPSAYQYFPELLSASEETEPESESDNITTGIPTCQLINKQQIEEILSIKILTNKVINLGNPDAFINNKIQYICQSNLNSNSNLHWFKNMDQNKSHRGYFNSPEYSTETTRFYMYEHEFTRDHFQQLIEKLEYCDHNMNNNDTDTDTDTDTDNVKTIVVPLENLLDITTDIKVGHALALRHRYLTAQSKIVSNCTNNHCLMYKKSFLDDLKNEIQQAFHANEYKRVGELSTVVFKYREEIATTKLCEICNKLEKNN